LLSEDDTLTLPDLEITIGRASLLSPKVVDESVREQRRARREEEKARKQAQAAKVKLERPHTKTKQDKKRVTAPALHSETPVLTVPVVERRVIALTPAEAQIFDIAHPSAGAVVTTEVPFDNVDPVLPEQQSKIRPALVVAASDAGLLVRGIYSNPAPSRRVFSPWRRLGLDHVSYIDDARSPVRADAEVNRLGVVSDDEWNSLL
jgi:hypothetical protein